MDITDSCVPDIPFYDELSCLQDELQQFILNSSFLDNFPELANMSPSERMILSGIYAALQATELNNVYTYLKIPTTAHTRLEVMICEIGEQVLRHYYDETKALIRHVLYWYLDYDTHSADIKNLCYPTLSNDEVCNFYLSLSSEIRTDPSTLSQEEIWFISGIIIVYKRVNELRYILDLQDNPIPFIQSIINDVSKEIRKKITCSLKSMINRYVALFAGSTLLPSSTN